MVRTKADAGVKVSGAKADRKTFPTTPSRSGGEGGDSKNKQYGGGNSYHPRETPGWQKPITTFFNRPAAAPKDSDEGGSSKVRPLSTS
ncbi:hypothetical protein ONE63_006733 [Megalurothrips usitatus]|uniref:PCNA-associated factor n=1 Tax=Megalurothrips usitatus TaxID=439358 RepID=A0AAV7XU21_9NEOP|nr:hypothetical protein ONE63_006733 [Megalurothrips usitatus]